jgi:hypothetical protein
VQSRNGQQSSGFEFPVANLRHQPYSDLEAACCRHHMPERRYHVPPAGRSAAATGLRFF